MSHVVTILFHIIHGQIKPKFEQELHVSQNSFKNAFGKRGAPFALNLLLEK